MTFHNIILPGCIVLAALSGCTPPDGPAAPAQGYAPADSVAFMVMADSLTTMVDGYDTVGVERISATWLRSPFARNSVTGLLQTLRARQWVLPKERLARESDSLYTIASARKDTLMLFALLVVKSEWAGSRDLGSTIEIMEQAFRLDPQRKLLDQLPDLNKTMAEYYDNVKQWDKALGHSAALIAEGLRSGDTTYMVIGHVYQACEFQQTGRADSIDRHLNAAMRLLPTVDGLYIVPSLYALMAGVERQRGRDKEAVPLLDSMVAFMHRNDARIGDYGLCAMELAYSELNDDRPQEAAEVARSMRESSQWTGSAFLRQCYHQVMVPIAIAHGDYRGAYENREQYQALRDSMNLTTAATNLRSIENNYKAAAELAERRLQEEAAAYQLQKERTRRNIMFIAGLFAVVMGTISYRQRRRTQKALKRSDELLLNILPEEVAEELKETGAAAAKHFDSATILFTDFKGFTEASEKLTPQELVEELNTCFKAFDNIITARGIEKIKTIGDAYMCAGGLPDPKTSSPADVVHAALEMQAFMITRKQERDAMSLPAFEMRVGIHTGPVVAGIVGVKKFQYDIWGDTVNTASRMESSGEVGQVNISEATYALVKDVRINEAGAASTLRVDRNKDAVVASRTTNNGQPPTNNEQPPTTNAFTFTPRGKVQAKGKGEMEMYFVKV